MPEDKSKSKDMMQYTRNKLKDATDTRLKPHVEDALHNMGTSFIDDIAYFLQSMFDGLFTNRTYQNLRNTTSTTRTNYSNVSTANNTNYQREQQRLSDDRVYYQAQFVNKFGPCRYGKVWAYVDTLDDANNVKATLNKFLTNYGKITVFDLYGECHVPDSDINWASDGHKGWTKIEDITYERYLNKYVFSMKNAVIFE